MIKLYKSADSEVRFPLIADDELRSANSEEAINEYQVNFDPLGLTIPEDCLIVVVRPLQYHELLSLEESAPYPHPRTAEVLAKARNGEDLDRDDHRVLRGIEAWRTHVDLAMIKRGVVRFEQSRKDITVDEILNGVKDRQLLASIVREAATYVDHVTRGPGDGLGK